MKKFPKIVIVMPAYNAARTVKETFEEIPLKYRQHVILVDDHSTDNTVEVAKRLGIKVFALTNNLGYGGNQKTCYWEAMKLNPDVVVMLHPDYQYDATMMPYLVQPILDGKYDYMFGSRIATKKGALKGGMPHYKYFINRIVCFIQNILLGVNFSEHFSGYRAYSRKLLLTIPYQRFSNDFGFDQEMTISSISYGMQIGEIPIPTRYHNKQSSIKLLKGAKFLLDGFWTISRYLLHSVGVVRDRRFALNNVKSNSRTKKVISVLLLLVLAFILKPGVSHSIWLKLFVFFQSMFLFFLMKKEKSKVGKILIPVVMAISVGIYILTTGVYKDTFSINSFERNQLWERREMYLRDLGLIGRFKLVNQGVEKSKFIIDRLTQKIAQPFDLARYFSVDPSAHYYLILFPFFLLGFIFLLTKKSVYTYTAFCLILVTAGSIFVKQDLTYWLFFPFINFCIVQGIFNFKKIIHD